MNDEQQGTHRKNGGADEQQIMQLRQALASSQRLTKTEQEKVSTLTLINDCLCEELQMQESRFANIQQLAYYDQLTGLPNRSLLQDRFQLAIANAVRYRHQLALLFLDLDEFKKINDEYGHAVGDKILQRVAKRLTSSLRAIDTACRYGGDEFVVLLPDLAQPKAAAGVASKISKTLSFPYHIDHHQHRLKVSIGGAQYPADGDSFAELVKKADEAMYQAKINGFAEPLEVVALDPGYSVTTAKKLRLGKATVHPIGESRGTRGSPNAKQR